MISARSSVLVACGLCAAAVVTGAAPVAASAPSTPPVATAVMMPRADMSIDQAVRMVEERYHARVVKVETQHDDGRTLYVLRLLNDAGKVWTVRVDAMSGSVE
ncbi:MAG TPA: PepSY domain-containing protein [Steroidobacteraceae bacterium]